MVDNKPPEKIYLASKYIEEEDVHSTVRFYKARLSFDTEYIRADIVEAKRQDIFGKTFNETYKLGQDEATKNIKAVWEKILRQNIEPIKLDSIEILKLYLMVMEAIKKDGINAGWLKEK